MLVGLTLTTEIFLASFSLASSCLSSSLANMAAVAQNDKSVSSAHPHQKNLQSFQYLLLSSHRCFHPGTFGTHADPQTA